MRTINVDTFLALFLLVTSLFVSSNVWSNIFSSVNANMYQRPESVKHFYDKNGLVNVSKKFRAKRCNPDNERILASTLRVSNRTVGEINHNENYYKKNGLVNIQRKYRIRSTELNFQNQREFAKHQIDRSAGLLSRSYQRKSIFEGLFEKRQESISNNRMKKEDQEVMSPR